MQSAARRTFPTGAEDAIFGPRRRMGTCRGAAGGAKRRSAFPLGGALRCGMLSRSANPFETVRLNAKAPSRFCLVSRRGRAVRPECANSCQRTVVGVGGFQGAPFAERSTHSKRPARAD